MEIHHKMALRVKSERRQSVCSVSKDGCQLTCQGYLYLLLSWYYTGQISHNAEGCLRRSQSETTLKESDSSLDSDNFTSISVELYYSRICPTEKKTFSNFTANNNIIKPCKEGFADGLFYLTFLQL